MGPFGPGATLPRGGAIPRGAPVRAPPWEAYLRFLTLPMGTPDSAPPVDVFVHHKRCLWERLVSKTTIVHYQLLKWCQPAPPTNCFKNKIDKHTNVFYLNLKLLSGISKLWGLQHCVILNLKPQCTQRVMAKDQCLEEPIMLCYGRLWARWEGVAHQLFLRKKM